MSKDIQLLMLCRISHFIANMSSFFVVTTVASTLSNVPNQNNGKIVLLTTFFTNTTVDQKNCN